MMSRAEERGSECRMDQIVPRLLRFDRFALDLTRGCLRTGDQEIALRPKPFEVLRHLAENAGRLVSKQELFEAVWPNVAVTDNSLVQCIRELRNKLGDTDHRLIKTVPRRGYLLNTTSTQPVEAPEDLPRAEFAIPAPSIGCARANSAHATAIHPCQVGRSGRRYLLSLSRRCISDIAGSVAVDRQRPFHRA